MIDPLKELSTNISSKLSIFGNAAPNKQMLHELINIAYLASLRTEEGRFVGGSITYADPKKPDICPPLIRRAEYPCFTAFRSRRKLTVDNLLKLSRAINNWTGSIAVYGQSKANLFIWGVVDQLSQQNIRLIHEDPRGFCSPGIVRINIDGIAALSIYHDDVFLGSLRQDRVVLREHDAFHSEFAAERIIPLLFSRAFQIEDIIGNPKYKQRLCWDLFFDWGDVMSRLCIGIRRVGTGGSLLITPTPVNTMLNIANEFPYSRLGDAMTLNHLDKLYLSEKKNKFIKSLTGQKTSRDIHSIVRERDFADTDASDRSNELAGAIKFVTSLAAVDGLVLMTPTLDVIGFGVKIGSGKEVKTLYDAASFTRKNRIEKKIDMSNFGTRHSSMLRYCYADSNAVGVIVSQDGNVRLILTIGRKLVMWENVKLLDYKSDLRLHRKQELRTIAYRSKWRHEARLGYTEMPKTIKSLLRYRNKGEANQSTNMPVHSDAPEDGA